MRSSFGGIWPLAPCELVRPLSALVFNAAGCPPTLLTSEDQWEAGLVADNPTHAQVVLAYMVYQ